MFCLELWCSVEKYNCQHREHHISKWNYEITLVQCPKLQTQFSRKTSLKRSFCMTENEHFGLVFGKTGSINSGTGSKRFMMGREGWQGAKSYDDEKPWRSINHSILSGLYSLWHNTGPQIEIITGTFVIIYRTNIGLVTADHQSFFSGSSHTVLHNQWELPHTHFVSLSLIGCSDFYFFSHFEV